MAQYCRFCRNNGVDESSGELLCNVDNKVKTYEQASRANNCKHFRLCTEKGCEDFFFEKEYIPRKSHKRFQGQTTIFDFMEDPFCDCEDINLLIFEIEKEFSKANNLKQFVKKYSVWDHVPKLGERLSILYKHKVKSSIENHVLEMDKVDWNRLVDVANKSNIELSIAITPSFISISTMNRKWDSKET